MSEPWLTADLKSQSTAVGSSVGLLGQRSRPEPGPLDQESQAWRLCRCALAKTPCPIE